MERDGGEKLPPPYITAEGTDWRLGVTAHLVNWVEGALHPRDSGLSTLSLSLQQPDRPERHREVKRPDWLPRQ